MGVSQAKEIYMELSRQLFTQYRLLGVSGLLLSHSYYNTKKYVEIIKNVSRKQSRQKIIFLGNRRRYDNDGYCEKRKCS
jgi:hypothetical protein